MSDVTEEDKNIDKNIDLQTDAVSSGSGEETAIVTSNASDSDDGAVIITNSASGGGDAQNDFKRTSRMRLYVRRFMRRPSAVFGLVVFILLVLFALFGDKLSKWSYDEPDFTALSQPPSSEHWLGTTVGGSDLYALIVRGLGRSLLVGIISSVLITIISAVIGTAIAYFGGIVEKIGMWILDTLLVIPSFLLVAMIVRSSSGNSGWVWLTIGITAFGWIGYARVIRTLTMSLRELDYVRAAKFMGVSSFRIILRHLIPNLGSVLIINTVLGVVSAVNQETALSFLGLGIKAPDTSLGTLLMNGQTTVITAPWILLIPSAFLILLTFSVQLIGDGLRDAIDPYSRSAGKAE